MTFTDYIVNLLALVTWREARGEGPDGMRAVAHVIKNRALAWKKDIVQIITDRLQFSSMTTPGDSQLIAWPQENDQRFEMALQIAEKVFDGEDVDNTGGALYYANLKTATSGWFFENIINKPLQHPKTAEIGHHTFFR
jgi:spore germination cell wall hydrolase CwlJ-like protein